jgi:hypothetical protein
VNCPRCKNASLRKLVSVYVECDGDCRSLDKKGIRKADVQIMGVDWDTATYHCHNCNHVWRPGKEKQ